MSNRRCLLLWSVLLAAGMTLGCKKQGSASNASAATNGLTADQPVSAETAPPSPRGPGPMPAAPPPAVIQQQTDPGTTLDQLSAELRKYVVRTRSVPKNFEDFLAKSQVQTPAPPAGKKYAIQNQAVVLINR